MSGSVCAMDGRTDGGIAIESTTVRKKFVVIRQQAVEGGGWLEFVSALSSTPPLMVM